MISQCCVIPDVFPEDICDLPPECESELGDIEEPILLSAKQVDESMKDGFMVFMVLD